MGVTLNYLDRHNADCGANDVMQRWYGAYHGCTTNNGKIQYTCTTPPVVWGPTQHDTGNQLHDNSGINYLDRYNLDCGAGKVMSQWDMDSASSTESKIKYTCVETYIVSTNNQETACNVAAVWVRGREVHCRDDAATRAPGATGDTAPDAKRARVAV